MQLKKTKEQRQQELQNLGQRETGAIELIFLWNQAQGAPFQASGPIGASYGAIIQGILDHEFPNG